MSITANNPSIDPNFNGIFNSAGGTAVDNAQMNTIIPQVFNPILHPYQQFTGASLGLTTSRERITIPESVVMKMVEDYLNEKVFKNLVTVKQITGPYEGHVTIEFVDCIDQLGGVK